MRRAFLFAAVSLFSSLGLFAQSVVRGKITDSKTGSPVSGASVKVKSSKKGTTTGEDGVFSLSVNPADILEISYVGYKTQSIKVNGLTDIPVSLEAGVSTDLNEIVVVGSRGAPRVRTESPVPIDVIKVNQIGDVTAKPDLMSQLNMAVPSFNYNKQSGGDGSDAIDFASLRGLGFDQTLVLINGKRRHMSAFVNEVGTRGRGNSGTDLNAIPEAAIDRIEILRDGASAQYGSDAIAGVINIVLKKDIHKLSVSTGFSGFVDHKYNTLNNVDPSQYYTGSQMDGKTYSLAMDYGLPIGKNGGFINIGGNYMNQGKTFRAVPDTNVHSNTNPADALPVNDWRRAAGDGSVVSGGAMYNMEIPVAGTKTTFYSFGGYNYKHSNVYAWTRRWHSSSNRLKFPTDASGNLIFVPGIMQVFDPTKGSLDTNNVFYNPQEDVYIKDMSAALGFRGTLGGNWDWDLSDNTGYNDFHYFGNKTFNASLPLPEQSTKTRFDDGGFSFLQNTANLDLSKRFNSIAQGVTVSFGGEFRYERYKLYAGEADSYRYGGATLNGTPKASGSEGYPGYQPSDASSVHRTNVGGYADIALDVTREWLIDIAERFENYSDFGFVSTQKLATRYKLADNFNIRGSVSSGFRAPSLQQTNFSNTNTSIIAGNLVYTKLVPNYSSIARAAGIPKLTAETSTNASLGFTWKPFSNLTLTLDAYTISIKNRIVISGLYAAGDPTLGAELNGLLNSQGIGDAQFFANAVNTTNRGLDIVVDYTKRWIHSHFKVLLAGNLQKLTINQINIPSAFKNSPADSATFFSDREQYFLKGSAPKAKFSLNLEYGIDKFTVGTHLTYFGGIKTLGFGETGAPAGVADPYLPYVTLDKTNEVVPELFNFKAKITTDLYASYKISKMVALTVGVDNIFNVHPNVAVVNGSVGAYGNGGNSWQGDSESGGAFDAVQMGSNGRRIFGKLLFNF
jgi:iron complex outermembrane recepter protein